MYYIDFGQKLIFRGVYDEKKNFNSIWNAPGGH